jgi:hypothetical protein
MGIFFKIMCKKKHDCRSFFDRDIKFQSMYFKIEQNSSEIYNHEKNHLTPKIPSIFLTNFCSF